MDETTIERVAQRQAEALRDAGYLRDPDYIPPTTWHEGNESRGFVERHDETGNEPPRDVFVDAWSRHADALCNEADRLPREQAWLLWSRAGKLRDLAHLRDEQNPVTAPAARGVQAGPRATPSRDGVARVTVTVDFRLSHGAACDALSFVLADQHRKDPDAAADYVATCSPRVLRARVRDHLHVRGVGSVDLFDVSEPGDDLDGLMKLAEAAAARAYPALVPRVSAAAGEVQP